MSRSCRGVMPGVATGRLRPNCIGLSRGSPHCHCTPRSRRVDRGIVLEVLHQQGGVRPLDRCAVPTAGGERAAVGDDGLADDPRGHLARQEQHDRSDVVALAVATSRHPDGYVAVVLLGHLVEVDLVRAGLVDRDRVDADVVAGELDTDRLRERVDRALVRGVRARVRHRANALHRREVDDASPLALAHARQHRVACLHRVEQVDAVEAIPTFWSGRFERAGEREMLTERIDQDVDAAERIDGAPDHVVDRAIGGEIADDAERPPAPRFDARRLPRRRVLRRCPTMTTSAPWSANARPHAAPMLPPPPVTTAMRSAHNGPCHGAPLVVCSAATSFP